MLCVEGSIMMITAKVFKNGRSRAVRIPAAFHLSTDEVYIHQNALGEIILTPKLKGWEDFWDLPLPECAIEREAGSRKGDPFADWDDGSVSA